MSDRTPLNVRVDDDVRQRFREFTQEKKGKIRGEMGRLVERAMREYMNRDRHARLSEDHDEIIELLNEVIAAQENKSTQTHTNHSDDLNDLNPQVRDGISDTVDNLTEGSVGASDVTNAVYGAGRTDDRTVQKYREVLEARGILLPDPREPNEDDRWIYGARKFALICENSPEMKSAYVEELVRSLEVEGRFTVQEYREALPNDYVANNVLKIDTDDLSPQDSNNIGDKT